MGNQSDLQKNTNQTLGEISDPNTSGSILEVGTEILHPLEDAGIYIYMCRSMTIQGQGHFQKLGHSKLTVFDSRSVGLYQRTWQIPIIGIQ